MIIDKSKFHSRLKKARREAKLKQEQVARYLQVSVSAVSAIEAGSRKVEAMELFLLAKLYNKTIGWFYKDYGSELIDAYADTLNLDPMLMEGFYRLQKAPKALQRKIAFHIMTVLSHDG